MTTEELLIHELAERAGVSVRTIRYYMDEGLLPQPNYEGKYSYYKLSFLDRLELIRRLKDSYLPLREIAAIMNSLTDEEVRKKLKGTPQTNQNAFTKTKSSQPSEKPGAKALEYIDQVMDSQTKYRMKGTQEKSPLSINQAPAPLFKLRLNQSEHLAGPVNEELWQRITLAPGVELHLHRPLDGETENRVQQVINFAKRIFRSKP